MPTHLTLGIAGHIDHGKTCLVRALTGVETDRLPEERERGMSIALGFAPLTLPSGEGVIDFIDVPGHERFVGTMISGASGIDALLLVIAATERIMPQTAEHLALANLLGVTRGIVAVTKSDLLDSPESRADSESAIRAYLAATPLADAPLIFTSTVTNEGIDTLRDEIERLLPATPTEQGSAPPAPFTLPIDRVFVLPGHGTIVTGTLQGGPIHIGDSIEIVPGSLKTETRALQVHGQDVQSAAPGWRVAVNLRGIKKEQLKRGDTLVPPATLRPTTLIDATLTLLPGATLKRGDQIRLHFNTTETTARAYPLDRPKLNGSSPNGLPKVPSLQGRWREAPDGWPPGQNTIFVQLRLTTPIAAQAGTPYIIRALSPAATLGGGRLLDLHPTRKSKLDPDAQTLLQTLADPNSAPAAKLALKLKESAAQGRSYAELTADLGFPTTLPPTPDIIVTTHSLAVHRDSLQEVQQLLLRAAESFHQENPRIEQGAPIATLRRKLPPGSARTEIVDTAIAHLAAQGALILSHGAYARTAAFVPQPLTPDEIHTLEILENTYRRAKLQPPDETAATKNDPVRRDLLRLMLRSDKLIAIPDRAAGRTHLFHPDALADLERRLCASTLATTGFTISDFTQHFNTTRKFAIPLLEYLDSQGKTRRERDKRYLSAPTGHLS